MVPQQHSISITSAKNASASEPTTANATSPQLLQSGGAEVVSGHTAGFAGVVVVVEDDVVVDDVNGQGGHIDVVAAVVVSLLLSNGVVLPGRLH